MTIELKLNADRRLEWAIGKIAEDKLEWMSNEYFPKIGPAMAEHGLNREAGFIIFEASTDGIQPVSGVFSSWPDADARIRLHNDPRFTEVEERRDSAMEMLSDGHIFESLDDIIALNTDSDYAVILAKDNPLASDPIFTLPLRPDSDNQTYIGKSLSLHPWSEAASKLMSKTPDNAEIYRIRFDG